MYPQAGISPDVAAGFYNLIQRVVEWAGALCAHLRDAFLPAMNAALEWIAQYTPSLSLSDEVLRLIFEYPSRWPVKAFDSANCLLKTHPHIIYIVSLSIFFGPIMALLPFLFLHELAISILFNLSFIMHGLLPGTADRRYDWLRSTLQDTRESLYSSVDATGATYNKWTTKYMPLIILRLVALGIGGFALYGIWTNGDFD